MQLADVDARHRGDRDVVVGRERCRRGDDVASGAGDGNDERGEGSERGNATGRHPRLDSSQKRGARWGAGFAPWKRCAGHAADGGAWRQRVGNYGAWPKGRQLHEVAPRRLTGALDMVHAPGERYIKERHPKESTPRDARRQLPHGRSADRTHARPALSTVRRAVCGVLERERIGNREWGIGNRTNRTACRAATGSRSSAWPVQRAWPPAPSRRPRRSLPLASPNVAPAAKVAEVLPLTSTSDVFVPPRGRAFMKFSFDFPEPSVAFGGLRFGFLVFTDENTYGLDASRMTADDTGDVAEAHVHRLRLGRWSGEDARLARRDVPPQRDDDRVGRRRRDAAAGQDRHHRSSAAFRAATSPSPAAASFDPRDNETLGGYTFGAGDLHGPGAAAGMTTPLAVVQAGEQDFFYLSSLDDRVRPKRFSLPARARARTAWRRSTSTTRGATTGA